MASDVTPLSATELAEIEGRHHPNEYGPVACGACWEAYPCDATRLLATLRERDELLTALVEQEPIELAGDYVWCTHCQRRAENRAGIDLLHADDCPYRCARERLALP